MRWRDSDPSASSGKRKAAKEEQNVLKWFGRAVLAAALAYTAWIEWSVLAHAGILWGLFFAMFFVPFALSATLAFFPAKEAGD